MHQADIDALTKFRDPATGEYPGRKALAELATLTAEVAQLRHLTTTYEAAQEAEAASKIARRELKSRQQRVRRAVARQR
jgi:hypothetical protein